MEIEIIYEDENLLAIDKPAGILAHGIKRPSFAKATDGTARDRRQEETLTDWLVERYPEIKKVGDDPENRPGIVHRLDKDTSGIMLIAKTQPYFEYLKSLFQKHEVEKTYRALVYGELAAKEGTIKKSIGIKPGTLKRTVFGGKKIQPAETRYKVLEKFKDFSLVEVWPKTGRTHQIRVHLSSIGHPVVGDVLYAGKLAKKINLGLNRQFLHAYSIEFNLESGKRVKLTADLPEDLDKAIKSLPL
jgi:23S rRNA pseudouridine1911/1915/1917 synthase